MENFSMAAMNLYKLIINSFLHFRKANLMAAAGLAVAVGVITGALIIGDSLSYSLEKAVIMRLGNITHSITAGDRLFTRDLGERFRGISGMQTSVNLVAEGMGVAEGGRLRLNRVQVMGVDSNFSLVSGTGFDYSDIPPGEVIISENMAGRLELGTGDFFQLSMKKAGVIPGNTPLVSEADQSVSHRVKVAAIAGNDDLGRFDLRVSQTAPFNVFVDIRWLNNVMDLEEMANIIFLSAPEAGTEMLTDHLHSSWEIEDINLTISYLEDNGRLEISSERVFIDENITSQFDKLFPESVQFLSYFVNSIEKGEMATPYSFVAAGSRYDLDPGETIINRWLADDLSAGTGDSLLMHYWETGMHRELTEKSVWLLVKDIVEMEEALADSILMPHLPGLSDAGNCRDWEAGVPVVLDRIREKDEDYWTRYRGTPKAYISLEMGQELWTNRFGNLTSVWLGEEFSAQGEPRDMIRGAIDPQTMGFRVNELRRRGMEAASGGVDFGMLFGGLGFFVMLAGVMLFFLLLLYNIENRAQQVKLFSSLGYQANLIRKIYLGEGMLVALAGSIGGLALAVLYGRLVFLALTRVWQDIVRTDLLEMAVMPSSLLTGLIIGISIAFLVTIMSINRFLLKKKDSTRLNIPDPKKTVSGDSLSGRNRRRITIRMIVALLLILSGSIILLRQSAAGPETDPVSFFISGGLLLPAFLLFADIFLLRMEGKNYLTISMNRLSMKNLARNRTRSLSVIILLALGIFVVIATGSNRKDAAAGETHREGGTGGFTYIAETTVPVPGNLNAGNTRLELNISREANFVQMMSSYADDASCLNLNQVANPRILSVRPDLLEGRFSFVSETPWLDKVNPWESLERDISVSGGNIGNNKTPVIPAIADQAVIQWSLGKKAGDTLTYLNENGQELKLVLIGGLANSVFQGNVIISESNFIRHFPSVSGSTFFLVDAGNEVEVEIAEELNFIFRDYGWEMTSTTDRLNEFNSVQNTYLGIFLMLGALGILLGVVGLAVVMARSIIERKNEMGLYTSMGFRRRQISGIIIREYLVLLLVGLAAGIAPALVASAPSLLTENQPVNLLFLTLLITGILLNGILWIVITSQVMLKNANIAGTLRND